jgi:hypothetical protein
MKNSFMFVAYENFSFKAPFTVSVQGINITVQCKIDTGCMKTCIPIKRLNVSDATAMKLKEDAIRSGITYNRTYGVSDTQVNKDADALLIKQGRLAECTSLRFMQHAEKFEIAGYDFGQIDVGVNYDRTGNILIGMDILSQMDIHIGKSRIANETVLLACSYDNINAEYLSALERHFALGTNIQKVIK